MVGQISTPDLKNLTYLPGTEEAITGSDKTIGRYTNERGKTLSNAWGKSLPEDLATNPEGGDPQVYWQTSILQTWKKGGNFLYKAHRV